MCQVDRLGVRQMQLSDTLSMTTPTLRRSFCAAIATIAVTIARPQSALRLHQKPAQWKRRVWPGVGALAFPCDPDADPRNRPALWSPALAPDVVILEAADPRSAISLPLGSEPLVEVATDAEHHVVVAYGTERLRLCVRHTECRPVPAISIPCDTVCGLRLAAATRLERVTRGGRVADDRATLPTAYQRARYVQLLGVHDALEAGTSSRDLAFGLVFPNHRPLSGAIWKGSGERRHVLRLIADARRLVAVGYRKLLLHR